MFKQIALSLCLAYTVNCSKLESTDCMKEENTRPEFAYYGEPCKGFNESTGEPYGECVARGHVCATRYDMAYDPGAECTCMTLSEFWE